MSVQAAVITIGNELTSGLVTDTNSAYLSRRLAEIGIVCVYHETADDHQGRIASAISRAAATVDVVVVAGGLGPTEDDVTRGALAEAMGAPLELHAESLREIEAFFRRRRYPMSESNRAQAMCPAGAEPLANPVGTAPGICARIGGARVFVVPGVPAEMRHLTDLHLLPRLADIAGDGKVVFRSVHAFGAGEGAVGAELADLMGRDGNPLVGTTVTGSIVTIRVTARGADESEATAMADQTVAEVQRRLGQWVYGVDEQTLASVVGDRLTVDGATLSVAESCTGGLLGKLITDVGGCSRYFLGGVISYANRIKRDHLGVASEILDAHGAVSEPTAAAMAEGVRERFQTTYGLAVTGIAGPTGGSDDKPVGLVYIALAGPEGVIEVKRNLFSGHRDMIRTQSALTALNMLRLNLCDRP